MTTAPETRSSVWAGVVLAADGAGRLLSRTPKPLHPLGGRPLVAHVLETLSLVVDGPRVVVQGPDRRIEEALGNACAYVERDETRGADGSLGLVAERLSGWAERLLVVQARTPLIGETTLRWLMDTHRDTGAALALLTASQPRSVGQGRVLRNEQGAVVEIVGPLEPGYDAAGPEVVVGAFCVDAAWLREAAPLLNTPDEGERLAMALVAAARFQDRLVQGVPLTDPVEALTVDTRIDLAEAERVLRRRTLDRLMLAGVTVLDPETTYVDPDVVVGQDTVLHPNTYLHGRTVIGEECEIGPGSRLVDTAVGDRCRVWFSALEEAVLEDDVTLGPFSHLRPGAYLSSGVHIGNFGEVKASRLGRNVAMGHVSYVGDAEIGDDVNIGAGTVTCNFDGVNKHRTIVEDGAFIGSDTMLVAPVRVGRNGRTGAGSVVTKDVPPDTLVAGVPARRIPGPRGSVSQDPSQG